LPNPLIALVAEGDLPSGEHWALRAGGTRDRYRTTLATIHCDGRSDAGGVSGPALHKGRLINVYTGGSDEGLRRFIVRADRCIQRLLVSFEDGSALQLDPVGHDLQVGLSFFAALLSWAPSPVSVQGLDDTLSVIAFASIVTVR
jgi:hypothetical protein